MSFFLKKRRFLPLLIPFILALIFFSMTGQSVRRATWYEELLWNVISPPQKMLSSISDSFSDLWSNYFILVGVKQKNDDLEIKVSTLKNELIAGREVFKENERLRALLSYHDSFPQKTVVARVVANDPRSEFKSVTINRGYSDGIEPLMPVIGPKGLVGKIGEVGANVSKVLLITDPNSAVDAMVQRSRARGLLIGEVSRTVMRPGFYLTRLEYLRRVSDVRDDDVVVTSGLDRIFPPGVPIGTLHDLKNTRYGVFREAVVVPFESMTELQEVLVLLSRADVISGSASPVSKETK
jgi:rod shape-determining protein MreC